FGSGASDPRGAPAEMRRMTSCTKPFLGDPDSASLIPPSPRSRAPPPRGVPSRESHCKVRAAPPRPSDPPAIPPTRRPSGSSRDPQCAIETDRAHPAAKSADGAHNERMTRSVIEAPTHGPNDDAEPAIRASKPAPPRHCWEGGKGAEHREKAILF